MFTSRSTTTVSLLALTLGVYVCLLATANAQALAQKSASAVAVAVQSQGKNGAQTLPGADASAQAENLTEEVVHQSIRLSSQDEKIVAASPMPREVFCALLSTYLSLS